MKLHSFLGADVLSPALHAVQPWTRQERHRMFCTRLWTLLDDVWRGPDDLYSPHLDHLRDLSESDTLHADTWPFWARGYPRLFLCNACELGMRISQTWSGIGLLSLLLRCWWSSPFGVLSGGCSFVIMLIKALVTSPAFALGMTPCHTGLSGTLWQTFHLCSFLETYHDSENPFGWGCHDHRLWRVQL